MLLVCRFLTLCIFFLSISLDCQRISFDGFERKFGLGIIFERDLQQWSDCRRFGIMVFVC